MQLAKDLFALTKPRIIVLLAITCLAGSLVAAKGNAELLHWPAVLAAVCGLMMAAGGANSVNMWFDHDIDKLMNRTRNRPLPQGRLPRPFVLAYGIALILLGTMLASFGANPLSGAMALSGALFYVFIYTIWLKRRTVQNIVIGGAAGAFPPLVGWAAVQGTLADPLPWLMFAVIFFWTPPHFWALALVTNADYTRAKVPMYPVVHGTDATRLAIVRYLLLLVPLTLAGGLMPPLSWLYLIAATGIGLWWGWSAWRLLHAPPDHVIPAARRVFRRSLSYLALIFAAMVIDSWL